KAHARLRSQRHSSRVVLLVLFFVLRRAPPRSAPFPYTTLFRSPARPETVGRSPTASRAKQLSTICRSVEAPAGSTTGSTRTPAQDRKSTRLNSSHVAISYAVFCLKKKNLKFISSPRFRASCLPF